MSAKKDIIDRIAGKLRGIRDLSGILLLTNTEKGRDIKNPDSLSIDQLTLIESALVRMIRKKIEPTMQTAEFGLYQQGSFLVIPHAFLESFGFNASGNQLATPEEAGVTTGRQGKSKNATPTKQRLKSWKPNPNDPESTENRYY